MRTHYWHTSTLLLLAYMTAPISWAEETTPPTPATPTAPPAAPTAPTAAPQVARSAFTTSINAREPVDQLARISAGQQVYYFTELMGLQGHVVTHRWEKDGAFQLGLQFPVGAERWRVHSNKNITADLPGIWTVTVQNDNGTILKQDTLVVDPVIPAEPAPAAPAAPAPAQPQTATPPAAEPPKEPTPSPATPAAPAPAPTSNSSQPIWEKLPR